MHSLSGRASRRRPPRRLWPSGSSELDQQTGKFHRADYHASHFRVVTATPILYNDGRSLGVDPPRCPVYLEDIVMPTTPESYLPRGGFARRTRGNPFGSAKELRAARQAAMLSAPAPRTPFCESELARPGDVGVRAKLYPERRLIGHVASTAASRGRVP